MNRDLDHLIERIGDLRDRMKARTSRYDEIPTWLHWSDVEVLTEAVETLTTQDGQISRARDALSVILKDK